MLVSVWTSLALGGLACTQPTLKYTDLNRKDPSSWPPALKIYFEAVGKAVEKFRYSNTFPGQPSCDPSKAVMPTREPLSTDFLSSLSLQLLSSFTSSHAPRQPQGCARGRGPRHAELHLR